MKKWFSKKRSDLRLADADKSQTRMYMRKAYKRGMAEDQCFLKQKIVLGQETEATVLPSEAPERGAGATIAGSSVCCQL
jgi:hypothetical protein